MSETACTPPRSGSRALRMDCMLACARPHCSTYLQLARSKSKQGQPISAASDHLKIICSSYRQNMHYLIADCVKASAAPHTSCSTCRLPSLSPATSPEAHCRPGSDIVQLATSSLCDITSSQQASPAARVCTCRVPAALEPLVPHRTGASGGSPLSEGQSPFVDLRDLHRP